MPRGLQPNPHTKLRELLAQARDDAGLKQAQVAALLKRPQSFVSKYENGERKLDVIEFIEVCKALGVSPSTLIDQLS
ncbi:helix-turn-helix domain-containing protein [Variovorax ureilyticus]|uniref:helix-turn-helix domain-containing protein n=1 Tax=Variovorax ureilyticus TaxID=1836198 RepID=UPI003D667881